MNNPTHYQIDFEPLGRRVQCKKGESLLEAAQRGGVMLTAVCGGEGVCGRCLVRVMAGQVSPPSLTEEAELNETDLQEGWRLACQANIAGEVRVYVPPTSLATAQRTQTEGQLPDIHLQPAVHAHLAEMAAPTLTDLRSDARRLGEALDMPDLSVNLHVLRTLSPDLRQAGFRPSVFVRGNEVIGVRPAGTSALGLAVDIGTTKLAAYLVDLASGETLALAGAMNPQIAYGEDVMARIGHTLRHPEGGEQLRTAIVDALNGLARQLCSQAGRQVQDIADAAIVGNTAMHHLFAGLPVKQLGLAPYVAAESAPLYLSAYDLGLELAPGAAVYLPPNIAGFVGADHVAMLLATRLAERPGVTLGMDIGTNTEISLKAGGKHFACSTASGPAFEGAHIRHGMRAAPGAIEKVLIRQEQVWFQTVESAPPVGLCGSGILDLVAQMRKAGIIQRNGSMATNGYHPRIRKGVHGAEFVVAEVGEDGETEITFSRADVNEIQLAKGAMRAGVNVLLQRAGISEQDIDTVIIAGAFGTYLDVQSGIDIGMFPRIERQRFVQVGNAAGAGARMALLSLAEREQAAQIARQVEYVELTTEKDFAKIFAKALFIE